MKGNFRAFFSLIQSGEKWQCNNISLFDQFRHFLLGCSLLNNSPANYLETQRCCYLPWAVFNEYIFSLPFLAAMAHPILPDVHAFKINPSAAAVFSLWWACVKTRPCVVQYHEQRRIQTFMLLENNGYTLPSIYPSIQFKSPLEFYPYFLYFHQWPSQCLQFLTQYLC